MGRRQLLLLPGMLCDERLFDHQIENLSDVTETSVGDITQVSSISGAARSVLEKAPGSFALVGLSLGGIVAFEILRQAPERVEGLALLGTNSRPPNEQQLESWDEFEQMTNDGRFEQVVKEYLLPVYFNREDPALEESAVQMASNVGEKTFLRQLWIQRDRPDSRGDLPDIKCPTLVAGGRQDALCSVGMQEEIASGIPDANLVIVENSGHLSSMEQPQAVTAILRYWLQLSNKKSGK